MAAWTDEQIAGAGNWLAQNIGNPELVKQEVARLGINQDDLLRAAQTQNQGITLGQVQQYMGDQSPAAAPTRSARTLNTSYTPSPYLQQQAQGIMQLQNRNLQEQILPGVRSNAIAAGGFGDARHGVAEGLAIGRTNDAIAREVTNLYGQDYQNAMNRNMQQYLGEMQNDLGYAGLDTQRYGIDTQAATSRYGIDQNNATQRYGVDTNNATQRYGIDQNYSLGMTNAENNRYGTDKQYEVGMANAAASAANAAANQAQAAGNLALGQQQLGLNGLFGVLDRQFQYGQAGQNSANTIQNTPLNYTQQIGQTANAIAGQNGSTTANTQQATNPWATALGGAQLANSWWNSQNVGGSAADTQNWTYAGSNPSAVNPAGNIDYIYG